jgi:hypothetical protein
MIPDRDDGIITASPDIARGNAIKAKADERKAERGQRALPSA